MDKTNDQLLTTAEVAELCKVSVDTVAGWRQRGRAPL